MADAGLDPDVSPNFDRFWSRGRRLHVRRCEAVCAGVATCTAAGCAEKLLEALRYRSGHALDKTCNHHDQLGSTSLQEQ